jgi:hypothetical protein
MTCTNLNKNIPNTASATYTGVNTVVSDHGGTCVSTRRHTNTKNIKIPRGTTTQSTGVSQCRKQNSHVRPWHGAHAGHQLLRLRQLLSRGITSSRQPVGQRHLHSRASLTAVAAKDNDDDVTDAEAVPAVHLSQCQQSYARLRSKVMPMGEKKKQRTNGINRVAHTAKHSGYPSSNSCFNVRKCA